MYTCPLLQGESRSFSLVLPHLPEPESAEAARTFAYWVGRLWQLFPFVVAVTVAVVFWYRLAFHVAHVAGKRSA